MNGGPQLDAQPSRLVNKTKGRTLIGDFSRTYLISLISACQCKNYYIIINHNLFTTYLFLSLPLPYHVKDSFFLARPSNRLAHIPVAHKAATLVRIQAVSATSNQLANQTDIPIRLGKHALAAKIKSHS